MEANQMYGMKAGIESLVSMGTMYSRLETQIMLQEPEEAEGPPEPLHTTWGVWLHKWDALHSIDQRHDTEHVLRTIRAADDILHYYHYVPVIGDHEHIHESYEMGFEYDYSNEEMLYNANIDLDEETTEEIANNTGPDEESNLISHDKDEDPDGEEKIETVQEQKNSESEFNKESVKMSEEILKLIK